MKTRMCWLAVLLLALPAFAKDPWNADFHKWSAHDCARVLSDSPWARTLHFGEQPITLGSQEIAREVSPQVTYVVQDRSAEPIREALVRQAEIAANYDQMPPDKRAAVDERATKFLAESFSDRIVIHVEYSSNAQYFEASLARYWQTRQPDTLKQSMFLVIPGQEDTPPSQVVIGKGGSHSFEMIFPRNGPNGPLVQPGARYLRVRFDAPQPSGPGAVSPAVGGGAVDTTVPSPSGVFISRIVIDFQPRKMMLGGKLEY